MLKECSGTVRGFCDACFTGNYPVRPEQFVGRRPALMVHQRWWSVAAQVYPRDSRAGEG